MQLAREAVVSAGAGHRLHLGGLEQLPDRAGRTDLAALGKEFITRGGRPLRSPLQGGRPGRLVGIDDSEVAIHDRDPVGHSARELCDRLKTSSQHGIREAAGCWVMGSSSGHLDLVA